MRRIYILTALEIDWERISVDLPEALTEMFAVDVNAVKEIDGLNGNGFIIVDSSREGLFMELNRMIEELDS